MFNTMNMRISQKKLQQQGFTLTEVMMVVAIISILAAVSIPNILTWLPNARLNSAARDLYGTIMKARGEAARRNRNCTIAFNQVIIDANGNPVNNVYVLFEDSNPANSAYDAGEPIIFQMLVWPQNVSLDTAQGGGDGISFPNRGAGCAGNPAITFQPNSLPVSDACGLANGSVFLTNTNQRSRTVVVNNTGSVRVN
jgi:prepilin-type N-terminal cleavage/methylation domain-containing protein